MKKIFFLLFFLFLVQFQFVFSQKSNQSREQIERRREGPVQQKEGRQNQKPEQSREQRVQRPPVEKQHQRVQRTEDQGQRSVHRRSQQRQQRVTRQRHKRNRHYAGYRRYYARGYHGYRGYGYYKPRSAYRYYTPERYRPWIRTRWHYPYGNPVYRVFWGTRYRYYIIPTRYDGIEHAVLLRHVESNSYQIYLVYAENPDDAADKALRFAYDTYGGGRFTIQWVRPTADTGDPAPAEDAPEEGENQEESSQQSQQQKEDQQDDNEE